MELITILATVILLATLLTLFFSFAAYFVTRAKKLRSQNKERREPSSAQSENKMETPALEPEKEMTPAERGRRLFERYTPERKETGYGNDEESLDVEDDQWK